MSTRPDAKAPMVVLGIALLFAGSVFFALFGPSGAALGPAAAPAPTATASPTPPPRPPEVKVAQDTCCAQTARFLRATWESSEAVRSASVALVPAPGFDCSAAVDGSGKKGTFGCVGLLPGATDYTATLSVSTAAGTFPITHAFRTMGDRLENVKWFTEFEDPLGEPLACAAASCRIIQVYTTNQDPMTAEGILALGRQFNRSADPGLDPAAIATVQQRLDPRNRYHYYNLATREEATLAAAYWLVRSGKPVMVITLAGQHAPLLIGFRGGIGTHYGDPSNTVTGVVVQDPQRGDVRPETASRRPDKYRSPGFQTGQLVDLNEWYRDEWWLGFAYTCCLAGQSIDRNDGAYPLPHWAGQFVIIVDDADAENPPDREGRVRFR